ncbi:MAG: NADH-quinone oxidoreductase subunit NuoE [Dehalococcoidia bacterium]|nr:MAG: NADH-quinone oxidoreductase subunit NuoE [Dehalococcoidia bacterium]
MAEAKKVTKADLKRIDSIIADYRGQRWSLIPLLQEIQEMLGYIPPEAIPRIARGLGLFPSQVQGVITFYTQLYTAPRGKNIVRVCRGTACHVRGGKTILKLVKQNLGIEEGETTPDMEYTLETVACIGVCALAPNIVINRDTHGQMNPKKVARLFSKKDEA